MKMHALFHRSAWPRALSSAATSLSALFLSLQPPNCAVVSDSIVRDHVNRAATP